MSEDNKPPEGEETPKPVIPDDMSESDAGSETPSVNGKKGSTSKREPSLSQKVQQGQHAKSREAARAKQASAKQAAAERRRLEEEINKLERKIESIERDFRKLFGAIRAKPLGRDRFFNRVWWFDGLGSASLLGSGGVTQYGTGRIFLEGPSEFDLELLNRKKAEDPTIEERQIEEEGYEGKLEPGDWAAYSDLEEVSPALVFFVHRQSAYAW